MKRNNRVTGEDPLHKRLFSEKLRRGDRRPAFSDQGRHLIRLALCVRGPGLAREGLAPALADSLFTPPIPYRGKAVSAGFQGLEGGESLIPCWAKPATDGRGWILRLHETLGWRGSATLKLSEGCKAYPTNLSESSVSRKAVRKIDFQPYQILSFRIVR
jgi:alpha-mannosidase